MTRPSAPCAAGQCRLLRFLSRRRRPPPAVSTELLKTNDLSCTKSQRPTQRKDDPPQRTARTTLPPTPAPPPRPRHRASAASTESLKTNDLSCTKSLHRAPARGGGRRCS